MIAPLRTLLLGAWAGAMLVWSLVVLPAAFGTLPGTELAAELVGVTLDRIDLYGIALALLTSALGLQQLRGSPRRVAGLLWALLPLVAGLCHSLSLFWLSPELKALRASAGGSVTRMTIEDPALSLFGQLHALSTGLFTAAGICVLSAAAWDLVRASRPVQKKGHNPGNPLDSS